MEKNARGMIRLISQIENVDRGMIISISLRRFRKGGPPPFASSPRNHHKAMWGWRANMPFVINVLRVWVFS